MHFRVRITLCMCVRMGVREHVSMCCLSARLLAFQFLFVFMVKAVNDESKNPPGSILMLDFL